MRAPINLQLAGTDNFRSLKGLPAHDGRRIAGHTLLRSDQLHMLGAEGWETLRTLGVKTVCDLRSEGERQRTPNNLPVELEQLALEVTGDMRADKTVSSLLVESPDLAGAEAMMFEVYRRLPGMLSPHLPKLFGLFETGNVPVLVHCAAGKDRTGFAVAVILHALGVARDVIVADYQLSARRMVDASDVRRELMSTLVSNMIGKPCPDEAVDVIMDARPEYLQTAYDCVDKHYGSMDAYIETCVGLDASGLKSLRDRYLTAD